MRDVASILEYKTSRDRVEIESRSRTAAALHSYIFRTKSSSFPASNKFSVFSTVFSGAKSTVFLSRLVLLANKSHRSPIGTPAALRRPLTRVKPGNFGPKVLQIVDFLYLTGRVILNSYDRITHAQRCFTHRACY